MVTTLLGDDNDVVDTGESDGSFTPTSGVISGRPIVITNDITSGIDSEYTLVFIPASSIPKNGYIYIYVPERLDLRPSQVTSGGICTTPGYICQQPIENNIIIIQTTQVIQAE